MKTLALCLALAGCLEYRSTITLPRADGTTETTVQDGRCAEQHVSREALCTESEHRSGGGTVAAVVIGVPLMVLASAFGSVPVH